MSAPTAGKESLTRRVGDSLDHMPAVADAGMKASLAVHAAVLRGGEPARNVADVLHGTWLGHPLHPVLTDVTIGAWTLGAAFDAIGALGDDDFARRVGDRLTAVGTASAVPTALTGLADYSTFPEWSATPATLHGLLNSVGLGLYVLSLRDRNNGRRRRGLFFSSLALGLTSASAWLGGHLVYKHKVGVDHSESFEGPEDWTPVLDAADLPDGQPRCAELDGKKVLVYRDGDAVYAIGAVCSHAGGPLHEGDVNGPYVECPWHHSVFDLRDGSIRHGPATQPQVAFDARIRDAKVEIRLAEDGAA
ncbi:MAG: Rieske 2Fe-2S domain-containing protein [Gemmatimonadetes bacterium]|nr:Rieske 2Fe-2S domain-containing protein [Gemmatimonadota bacterium]